MRIVILPVSKPRQTRADVWKQRAPVMRYRAFADELRLIYREDLPVRLRLIFEIPIPKSYSKKKRASLIGQPHQLKPDIDNLEKAVMDALLKEDCAVWDLHGTKLWSEEGAITIEAIR